MATMHGMILLLLLATAAAASARAVAPGPWEGSFEFNSSKLGHRNEKCDAGGNANRQPWEFSWPGCMSDILYDYIHFEPCKNANVMVWRYREPGKRFYFTPSTQFPAKVTMEDNFFARGGYFKALCFHGPAYFETNGGWHGWENWGFYGKFSHVTGTNTVTFTEWNG